MTGPLGSDPIEVDEGTPLADAVTEARAAYSRTDVPAADRAYLEACGLAGSGELRTALATEHCAKLLEMRAAALALQRCDEHLAEAGNRHAILLLRAEIRISLGSHVTAEDDVRAVQDELGDRIWSLKADHHARLLRVEGFAAADRGEPDLARKRLVAAKHAFGSAGNAAGEQQIERDLQQIGVRTGAARAVDEVIRRGQPRTAAGYLTLAMALKRELHYEEAAKLLHRGVDDPGVDPSLHLPLLCELVVLYRTLRQGEEAEKLYARIAKAAAGAPDRVAAEGMIANLIPGGSPVSVLFDDRIRCARRLIAETRLNAMERKRPVVAECTWRLDEAEKTLLSLRDRTRDDTDVIVWHLAAGELELARFFLTGREPYRAEAVKHLAKVSDDAATTWLAEVKAFALRLLGHACYRGADHDGWAVRCWDAAHRLEEEIADRQTTDDARIVMLRDSPDEHDERVRAAAAVRKQEDDPEAKAGVVVAVEAARGATILDAIPAAKGANRLLPPPNDLAHARRWVDKVVRVLPRDQAVWMMHATPHDLHHVILSRHGVRHITVAATQKDLGSAVDELRSYWSAEILDAAIADGSFERALAGIVGKLGLAEVIPEIPPEITRVAIVAGRKLAEVPFSGLLIPGTGQRIIQRYALSDLPCLSALLPLRKQSRRQRGNRTLLVSPPNDELTAAKVRRRPADLLEDAEATPDRLRARLETRRHRLVRIDSHGEYLHNDPSRSVLRLAPEGPEGHVTPAGLAEMNLKRCGTLILGACDSGMGQPRGRDERTGFVRAAVRAGAASVVAARWVADDRVAAFALDRFERHCRYLPRDVALQRAQLDVLADAVVEFPAPIHPARWACWTLYCDSGNQAKAISRFFRRVWAKTALPWHSPPTRSRKTNRGPVEGETVHPFRSHPPKVFISFAGEDRPKAKILSAELAGRGIETFIDEFSIQQSDNIVLAINDALEQSDYFVLLWSEHTVERPWVDMEWTYALTRDLGTKRAFLFVVRLDDTELKSVLKTRKYINGTRNDWAAVAEELAGKWRADLNEGLPVLPAPGDNTVDTEGSPMIEVRVRNLALTVEHVIQLPPDAPGTVLYSEVRAALQLRDEVSELGGKVGMKFHYSLGFNGEAVSDEPLDEQHITDGATVDLTVDIDGWGPDGSTGRTTFRTGEPAGINPQMWEKLLNQGFDHLKPRED